MSIPFCRIGSKRRIVNKVLNRFPSNYEEMIYVEPFFGSGSIFFNKKQSQKEVINDLDKDLMNSYKNIKKIKTIPDSYPELENIKTDNELTAFYKSKSNNPFQQFYKDVVKYCSTFGNKGTNNAYVDKKPSLLKSKYIPFYQERLKNAVIHSKDYKGIIKQYDSVNTLFYLDPPYEDATGLYKNSGMNFEELQDILKNIKGKFVLSLNDSSKIRRLFKDFTIKGFTHEGVGNKNIGVSSRKEVIISNF